MPNYDYKCDNCGFEFEIFQSMKDDKLTKCPECKKNKLVRLIGSGGGLIFKGSGFYLTDYKNKSSETAVSGSSVKETSGDVTSKEDSSKKPASEPKTSKSENKNSDKSNSEKKVTEKKSPDSKVSDKK